MKKFLSLSLLTTLIAVLAGCGKGGGCGAFSSSGCTSGGGGGNQSQPIFLTVEDTPVSSVVSFNITIKSITLSTGSSSVSLLSTPTAVDFGRLVGLRSLLGFNSIAPGSYTSATFTFEASSPAPSINYIDFSTASPSLQQLTGVLSSNAVTVQFPTGQPLVVSSSGLAGLHIDFDLRSSLATDTNGQLIVTNNQIAIAPVLDVAAVSASDDLGQITDFSGTVVSVNSSANSFLMQGPYGFQETVKVNAGTSYNGTNSLSSLTTNSLVSVIGVVQADGSISATGVELITNDAAFVAGRILAVNPGTGPVATVTMFVDEELGSGLSGIIPVDTVQTINLSGVVPSSFGIGFFDNWSSSNSFSATSLVVGQRILLGGTVLSGAFVPDLVSLRRQGVVGSLVNGSVTITGTNKQGNFLMLNDALLTYSAGGPFTVFTGDVTTFVNLTDLTGLQTQTATNLIVRGLVFKDPVTGKPVIYAGRVRVLSAP